MPLERNARELTAARSLMGDRTGGSLLEVIIALILLSFGMLGMATTTAAVIKQTTLADITNERVAAAQWVAEGLRSMPFDNLASGSNSYGAYDATWTVTSTSFRAKQVQIVTVGPMVSGAVSTIALHPADTLSYTVVR